MAPSRRASPPRSRPRRAARRPASPGSRRNRRSRTHRAARPRPRRGPPAGRTSARNCVERCAAAAPSARLQPDLRAALRDRDHHHVRDAHAADQQRDGAEAEEQCGEGALGCSTRLERLRGLLISTSSGCAGLAVAARTSRTESTSLDPLGRRFPRQRANPRSNRSWSYGPPDERGPVEVGVERQWIDDADDGEPAIAEPHPDPAAAISSIPSRLAVTVPSTTAGICGGVFRTRRRPSCRRACRGGRAAGDDAASRRLPSST